MAHRVNVLKKWTESRLFLDLLYHNFFINGPWFASGFPVNGGLRYWLLVEYGDGRQLEIEVTEEFYNSAVSGDSVII